MELINETPFATRIYRGAVYDDTVHATVVVRSIFDVAATGALSRDRPQAVRVNEETGPESLEDDGAPCKQDVDVCVLGVIEAPAPGCRVSAVAIRVGDVVRTLQVTGDRKWTPRPGADFAAAVEASRRGEHDPSSLVATEPAPFERIPMSWTRAFGGQARVAGGNLPCPENPLGRGFLLTLDGAEGTLLPNLEDPDQLVASWQDQPVPMCFAPVPRPSRLRLKRGVSFDATTGRGALSPAFFNVAHPSLTFGDLAPSTAVRLEGMSASGAFECRIPEVAFSIDVRLGSHSAELPLRLDTVELNPTERTLALVSRTAFRYRIRSGEDRLVRVLASRA